MFRAIDFSRGGNGLILTLLLLFGALLAAPAQAQADGCPAAGTLTGAVYLDADASGSREATETGVGGVTVVAFGAGRTLLASCATGADGAYTLDIAPEAFPVRLEFREIAAPLQPGPFGPDSGAAVDVVSAAGARSLGLIDSSAACLAEGDANCVPVPVELGDRVWLDENGDGYQDAEEPGFMGLVVNAYIDSPGGGYMLRATNTTDENGRYRFRALEPSTTYYIVVEDVSTEGGGDLLGGPLGPSLGADLYRVNASTATGEMPWAGYPYLTYTVGPSGEINHDLDFAFAPQPVSGPTAITWDATNTRSLLQSPFLGALLLLAVLLGILWLVVRSLVLQRRKPI